MHSGSAALAPSQLLTVRHCTCRQGRAVSHAYPPNRHGAPSPGEDKSSHLPKVATIATMSELMMVVTMILRIVVL